MTNAENENTPIYKRKIADINSGNISDLKTVEEGWFVEFKSELQESKKTAKSLSAFANAHGGILVIGAGEDNKTRRIDKFKPMDQGKADEVIIKIRQAAETHLMPCPLFFPKSIEVIDGSDPSENGWIVVVEVPKGNDGPYLHSSGAIYIRKGDSSSPIPLNDVGLVEKMWLGKEREKQKFEQRINFLCNQFERKYPRIDLFIKAENKDGQKNGITFDEFRSIAQRPTHEGSEPLFGGFYPLDSSYVARFSKAGLYDINLVWDFDYKRGLHYIQIPIATHLWPSADFEGKCEKNRNLNSLHEYLLSNAANDRNSETLIVDLGFSLYVMGTVLHMITSLHGNNASNIKFRANARAASMKNCLVFVDVPGYEEHLKKSAPPFVYRDIDFLSNIDDANDWLALGCQASYSDQINIDVTNSLALFVNICNSVGIDKNILMTGGINAPLEESIIDLAELFSSYHFDNFSVSFNENKRA